MKAKKLLSIALASMLAIASFTGCGKKMTRYQLVSVIRR